MIIMFLFLLISLPMINLTFTMQNQPAHQTLEKNEQNEKLISIEQFLKSPKGKQLNCMMTQSIPLQSTPSKQQRSWQNNKQIPNHLQLFELIQEQQKIIIELNNRVDYLYSYLYRFVHEFNEHGKMIQYLRTEIEPLKIQMQAKKKSEKSGKKRCLSPVSNQDFEVTHLFQGEEKE